jgi:hypothetical protein
MAMGEHGDKWPLPGGMRVDLALRVGQDTSYVPAELDVTGVADLPRSGIGRKFGEGGPQRHHWLLCLHWCHRPASFSP